MIRTDYEEINMGHQDDTAEYQPLKLSDTVTDAIVKMAQGNPGAITVLMQILSSGPHGFLLLLDLDDMKIRGSSIWVGYKDFAREDLDAFMFSIESRDPEMLRVIEAERRLVASYKAKDRDPKPTTDRGLRRKLRRMEVSK